MPKIHEMLTSNFLKKEDVGTGVLLTVEGCIQKNVAKEGADPEMKWCLTFSDCDKPMVLNSTNIQLCKNIFDSDDTDHWVGKKVVLYTDPNVSFGGKLVGGIRVRKPKSSAVAAPGNGHGRDATIDALKAQLAALTASQAPAPALPVPPTTSEPLTDDDIPFAWLMPLVAPMVGLLGLGVLFA